MVGDDYRHQTGLVDTHAAHQYYYIRSFLVCAECALVLGDDAHCAGVCCRRFLDGASWRDRTFNIILADSAFVLEAGKIIRLDMSRVYA